MSCQTMPYKRGWREYVYYIIIILKNSRSKYIFKDSNGTKHILYTLPLSLKEQISSKFKTD